VHLPVEPGGVVGHLDPDLARIDLGLTLEGFLDLCVHLDRTHGWGEAEGVGDADHPAHVADHALDLVALESWST
jgi:hypothetical protein